MEGSAKISLGQGRRLANFKQSEQLDFIAKGLPILMKSADNLLESAQRLYEFDKRCSFILRTQAQEEIAKILILLDIVRCPKKKRPDRIGHMMRWFYSHLAHFLYIEAQSWNPTNTNDLQKCIDDARKSHWLDGEIGEIIMPNIYIWHREGRLYADIAEYKDNQLEWHDPLSLYNSSFCSKRPVCWDLCNTLNRVGAFSREGLDIISSIWGKVEFKDDENWEDSERLTSSMIKLFEEANLIKDGVNQDECRRLFRWQLPMYHLDFRRIDVSLDKLHEASKASVAAEMT